MRGVLALVAICVAGVASAQDRLSPEQCSQTLRAVEAVAAIRFDAPEVTVSADGWCVVDTVEIALNTDGQFALTQLRWRGADFDRFINDGLPPRALEVDGRGVRPVYVIDDAVLNYLINAQFNLSTINFGVNLRWDGVQNTVFVGPSFLEFDRTNRIDLTARIDGIDLNNMISIQSSAGTAGLSEITISASFDGWFEAFALRAIGSAMLERGEVPPEGQVAALKQQAAQVVLSLPEPVIPEASREALAGFIQSFPNPRGDAALRFSAAPPFGAPNVFPLIARGPMADVQQVLEEVLSGVVMSFEWRPQE